MGLLDALNLRPPAAKSGTTPPPAARPAPQRGGPPTVVSRNDKAGGSDNTKLPGSDVDPRIKNVEDAINDPEKRLKALADWKIPRYAKQYDDETEDVKFVEDFQSGLESAKKYAEYIQKATEYAQKFGDLSRIAEISQAAKGIKDITAKVAGPLGKWVNRVKTGKEALELIHELDRFADATAAMDMHDIASVQRWVKASKSLYNAAEPFVSWIKSDAVAAAFAGSKVAAAASVTLSYVAAEFYVALQILDVGLANEKAYFDRYKKIMRMIDNGGVWASPTEVPPHLPPPWESQDFKAYKAHEQENAELRERVRDTIRAEKYQEQRKREAEIAAEREKHKKEIEAAAAARDAAKKQFDETEFPTLYRKVHRPVFQTRILAAMRASKKSGNTAAGNWWECMLYDANAKTEDIDDPTGVVLAPRKRSISLDDARGEISSFRNVTPPYPGFDQAYAADWKAYAAQRGVSEQPP